MRPATCSAGPGQAAARYRRCGQMWSGLAQAALPDTVPVLEETHALLLRSDQLFSAQGQAALPEMLAISARLRAIEAEVSAAFPLDSAGIRILLGELQAQLRTLHTAEVEAAVTLQSAIA